MAKEISYLQYLLNLASREQNLIDSESAIKYPEWRKLINSMEMKKAWKIETKNLSRNPVMVWDEIIENPMDKNTNIPSNVGFSSPTSDEYPSWWIYSPRPKYENIPTKNLSKNPIMVWDEIIENPMDPRQIVSSPREVQQMNEFAKDTQPVEVITTLIAVPNNRKSDKPKMSTKPAIYIDEQGNEVNTFRTPNQKRNITIEEILKNRDKFK